MTKAILATTLLALCIAAQVGCGSSQPPVQPPPLPLEPQRTHFQHQYAPPTPMLIEDLILRFDAAARVRMIGASGVDVEHHTWDWLPGPYVGVVEFRFESLEWLKGGDGSGVIVAAQMVSNGHSEEDARAKGKQHIAVRDKRWDDRDAIVFLKNSNDGVPSTREPDRYFLGYRTQNGYDSYALNANRTWLPLADAAVASGTGGEPEFLMQDPAGSPLPWATPLARGADGRIVVETLTLTKLRKLFGLSEAELQNRIDSQTGLMAYGSSVPTETNIENLYARADPKGIITIRWNMAGINPDVIGYRILRRKQSDSEFIELANMLAADSRSYTDTQDIQPDTEYIYLMRAYGNQDGDIADAHLTITTRPALDPLGDATATPAPK